MKGKKLTIKEREKKAEGDKIERAKLFKELCAHVEAGYSMDCFGPLSITSIEAFFKKYPDEFIQEEVSNSLRKAKTFWEDIGKRQATGQCMGNSRSWFYNMAQRYGWSDRVKVDAEHKGQVNINVVSYASKKTSTSMSE